MSRPFRALATLTGAAALSIAGLSPASAAYWRHDDAVGDVQSQTVSFDEEAGEVREGALTSAPENTDTDVTRATVDHRTYRVVLRTTVRDLAVHSGFVVYDLRAGTRRFSVVQRLGTDRSFPAFFFSRADGVPVRCEGVGRSVNRVSDRATLSIPRRCLGRPGWVRVGAGVAKFDETETSFTVLVDDAMQDAVVSDDLAMSPRVRRD